MPNINSYVSSFPIHLRHQRRCTPVCGSQGTLGPYPNPPRRPGRRLAAARWSLALLSPGSCAPAPRWTAKVTG